MSRKFTEDHQSVFPFIDPAFADDVLITIEMAGCPLSYPDLIKDLGVDDSAEEITIQVMPEIAKALESVGLAKVFRGVGGGLGLPDMENSAVERKTSPKAIAKQISPELISLFKRTIESLLITEKKEAPKSASLQLIANKVCMACPSVENPSPVRIKQLEMLFDRNEFDGVICVDGIVSKQKKQAVRI